MSYVSHDVCDSEEEAPYMGSRKTEALKQLRKSELATPTRAAPATSKTASSCSRAASLQQLVPSAHRACWSL